jgi:hypothetical protein
VTTFYQPRLAYWRAKFGPRGEELAQLNAEADAMAEYRNTEDYKRKRAEWMEFMRNGYALVKSGVPGVIRRE